MVRVLAAAYVRPKLYANAVSNARRMCLMSSLGCSVQSAAHNTKSITEFIAHSNNSDCGRTGDGSSHDDDI